MYELEGCTLERMLALGQCLGEQVKPGDVITLSGDLGAGKTTTAQAVAQGLGIKEPVSSPTFTIIKEYTTGRIPLYHFDLYRLGESAIYEDLGYDEYFFGSGVCVIEWAEYIQELLPENRLHIDIFHGENQTRNVLFSFCHSRWEPVVREMRRICHI